MAALAPTTMVVELETLLVVVALVAPETLVVLVALVAHVVVAYAVEVPYAVVVALVALVVAVAMALAVALAVDVGAVHGLPATAQSSVVFCRCPALAERRRCEQRGLPIRGPDAATASLRVFAGRKTRWDCCLACQ